jgi:hypothetical protein
MKTTSAKGRDTEAVEKTATVQRERTQHCRGRIPKQTPDNSAKGAGDRSETKKDPKLSEKCKLREYIVKGAEEEDIENTYIKHEEERKGRSEHMGNSVNGIHVVHSR